MARGMKPIFLNLPGHLINLQHVRSIEVDGPRLGIGYREGRLYIPYESEEEAEQAFAAISAALYVQEMTIFELDGVEEEE
jgi:hypothetical protein